jgi:U2 small nuclear ribonucleoprotein A'
MGAKSKASEIAAASTDADTAAATSKLSRIKLTDSEKKRLQEMIKNASSLQEIIRLEKELNDGRLPAGVHAYDDAMEE